MTIPRPVSQLPLGDVRHSLQLSLQLLDGIDFASILALTRPFSRVELPFHSRPLPQSILTAPSTTCGIQWRLQRIGRQACGTARPDDLPRSVTVRHAGGVDLEPVPRHATSRERLREFYHESIASGVTRVIHDTDSPSA